MWKVLIVVVFIANLMVDDVSADCNQCVNGHACTGINKYRVCTGSKPQGENITCTQENDVCTADHRCISPELSVLGVQCLDHRRCNDCDGMGIGSYACVNRTAYVQCGSPLNANISCSGAEVCNIDMGRNGEIPCTTKAASPTCRVHSAENAFCDEKRVSRRFPDLDKSTCTGFIYCYSLENEWVGSSGNCPNGRYFNYELNTCQATKPRTCDPVI